MSEVKHLTRLDAAESAFFQRELDFIKAQTFDVRFPTLKARDFVPVSNEVNSGAEQVTYRQMDRRGKAKIISRNAKDIPRVDVFGREFSQPVREVAAAYGWTLKELRAAQMANRNLNADRAVAARRAIEEELDDIAAFGAVDYGIPSGFLNNATVPTQNVTTPWASATPADILADVSAAIQRISAATLGVQQPNTVLLPTAVDALIATTPRSTTSDTTIKSYIMMAFPMITAIEPWEKLNTAGASNDGRMVVYERDPSVLLQEIPQEFESLPVQEQGLEFLVHSWAMTAGTQIKYPLAIDYSDNVST